MAAAVPGRIVDGGGFGIALDVIVRIVGALIGGWLGGALRLHPGSGTVASLITALIGAVILLALPKFSAEEDKADRMALTRTHFSRKSAVDVRSATVVPGRAVAEKQRSDMPSCDPLCHTTYPVRLLHSTHSGLRQIS
ncbi:hypothetical protein CA602_13550 [Paraburkholderia hospita]|nr:hypothetical protein CA602_13550 [Paraburkholderia hospita]